MVGAGAHDSPLRINGFLGSSKAPTPTDKTNEPAVGEGLAPPEIAVKLIPCGEVVKEQLQLFETRFPSVAVEDYVIMPDHIHTVIFLYEKAGGASPSPTRAYIIRSIVHRHNTTITPNYHLQILICRSV